MNNNDNSYKTDDRPSGTLHDLEDSIRAMNDRPSMERELTELRERCKRLGGEVWQAFHAGRDSVGWKDDQITRVDYTFEEWSCKGDKTSGTPAQDFEQWCKEYGKEEK